MTPQAERARTQAADNAKSLAESLLSISRYMRSRQDARAGRLGNVSRSQSGCCTRDAGRCLTGFRCGATGWHPVPPLATPCPEPQQLALLATRALGEHLGGTTAESGVPRWSRPPL